MTHKNKQTDEHKPGLIEKLWHFIENDEHPYNGGFFHLREQVRKTRRLVIVMEGGVEEAYICSRSIEKACIDLDTVFDGLKGEGKS